MKEATITATRLTVINQEGDSLHIENDINDCDVINLIIDGSEFWLQRAEVKILVKALQDTAGE